MYKVALGHGTTSNADQSTETIQLRRALAIQSDTALLFTFRPVPEADPEMEPR